MRRMLEAGDDEFYYVTVMNENYAHPSLPPDVGDAIVRGMYRLESHGDDPAVRLLGSGTILREVQAAAAMLAAEWGIGSEVFSVTSFAELAREAREVERHNGCIPATCRGAATSTPAWATHAAPVVAATDYVRAYPELIAAHVRAPFTALGTDGFGRSDTRARLRRFFEVDRQHVVVAALAALADEGDVSRGRSSRTRSPAIAWTRTAWRPGNA